MNFGQSAALSKAQKDIEALQEQVRDAHAKVAAVNELVARLAEVVRDMNAERDRRATPPRGKRSG